MLLASMSAVALVTMAGAAGCGSTDCNDTATCPVPSDDVFVTSDGFVETMNEDGAAAVDTGDAIDDTVATADTTVDSSDSPFETGDELADANDAAGDASDGGVDANDGSMDAPVPVDMGTMEALAPFDAPPEAPPPVKCKSNVLALKGAFASSFTDPKVAAGAIDKDFATRWESVWGVDPQWIYVDLGAPVFINRVQILWLRACAANYDIQVSNNAMSWMTIMSIINNGTGSSVSPTDWSTAVDNMGLVGVGRYLRILGKTRCDTNYGYSMWEMQVSGDPNVGCSP